MFVHIYLDPADDANFTSIYPFNIPLMKARCGQSLMHWFFERVILKVVHICVIIYIYNIDEYVNI
jgi:nitric oxide reductase large subunit